MPLVDIDETIDKQTSAIEVDLPKPDELSSAAPIFVRKVQRLDVDAVLARSLPSLGAFATRDVKTIVLR